VLTTHARARARAHSSHPLQQQQPQTQKHSIVARPAAAAAYIDVALVTTTLGVIARTTFTAATCRDSASPRVEALLFGGSALASVLGGVAIATLVPRGTARLQIEKASREFESHWWWRRYYATSAAAAAARPMSSSAPPASRASVLSLHSSVGDGGGGGSGPSRRWHSLMRRVSDLALQREPSILRRGDGGGGGGELAPPRDSL
jgi:hypothetical protein